MNKIERPFRFDRMSSVKEFAEAMCTNGIVLPCSDTTDSLTKPILINGIKIRNRMAIHPCEGFDGTPDGKPAERIFRRYKRYANGGAAMIWYEAIAVSADGRCNPYQVMISDENVKSIAELVMQTNAASIASYGEKPYSIVQLTHSGRTSVDENWNPIPLVAFKNPYIDNYYHNLTIASDERLEQLEQEMIHAAELSMHAGFDAVDIKLCHNYIMRELLAGFTRPGKFGGSYENRTRFLFDVIDGIKKVCGEKIAICSRINAYDCIPYPYGWGMKAEPGAMGYDLQEPVRLIKELCQRGIRLFNISTMMPRFSPDDHGFIDSYSGSATLNPYKSTAILLKATHEIKQAVPESILVATGLSWFDRFGANVGAGGIGEGWFDIAGFGRQAFAYPDFACDIINNGQMEHDKCCVTCDGCYRLIKLHENSGCIVHDAEEYLPLLKKHNNK